MLGVDLGVLLVAWFLGAVGLAIWMVILGSRTDVEVQRSLVFFRYVWLSCSLTYLTAIKASRVRTLGLLVAGTRIVTLRDDRPSTLRMSYRLCLLLIAPFNLLFDLIWLGGDPCNNRSGTNWQGLWWYGTTPNRSGEAI
jgi:hypothetical protein